MATLSLSPTPFPTTVMSLSSRRVPLTSNPNVANSPLRGPSTQGASYAKQKRSYATVQREELYGQPPPVKRQALDNGSNRARSPSKIARPQSQLVSQRGTTRPSARERNSRQLVSPKTSHDADAQREREVWKKYHINRFPKMVFYFESIPDDIRAKLAKRVVFLQAVRVFHCLCLLELCMLTILAASRSVLLQRSDPCHQRPTDPSREERTCTRHTCGSRA